METYSKFLIDLTNIIDNLLNDPRKIDRTIDNTLEQSIQAFVANYSNNKVKDYKEFWIDDLKELKEKIR